MGGAAASKSAAAVVCQADRPCTEVIHRHLTCAQWSPACFQAGFSNGLKIYGPLFIITAILQSKFRPKIYDLVTKTLPAILRSSTFLGLNSSLYPLIICIFSRVFKGSLGHVTMWTAPFLASLAAISAEKPSRRTELTVYVSNQAAEGIYRALIGRGILPSISRGSDILYSLSFATLVLFHKTNPELVPSSVRMLLNVLVGNEEKADVAEKITGKAYRGWKNLLFGYLPGLFSKDDNDKSRICKHHSGCKSYGSVGFIKAFLLALGIRSLFIFPAALFTMGPIKFILRFKSLLLKLFTRSTMNFTLFFGIMSGGTRAATCLLRYLRERDDGVNSFLAGLVGSLGVIFFSNVDFAMYFVSKAAENLFSYAVEQNMIRSVKHGSALLYAASTATLFYLSAWEPHHLRDSYWNFLMKTSSGNWMHFFLSFWPVKAENGIADKDAYAKWETEFNSRLVKKYITPGDFDNFYRQHIAPWMQ